MNLKDFIGEEGGGRRPQPREDWDSLRSGISKLDLDSGEFWTPLYECESVSKAMKTRLRITGRTALTKDRKRVRYIVERNWLFDGEVIADEVDFEKQAEAFEFAYSEIEFIRWCRDKGIWFDGRRYLWKFDIEDGNFIVGERFICELDEG